MSNLLTEVERADLAAWTTHVRPDRANLQKGHRPPMTRERDYDQHVWHVGGVMGIGAPLHLARKEQRRRERIEHIAAHVIVFTGIVASVAGVLLATSWIIRGIAGIGG